MKEYSSLINEAIIARKNAYSPYSKFSVGCALICSDGEIFTGCNIENASYSETICAERTAIVKAVSQGKRCFKAIAIVGGIDEITDYTYPCGSCRQVLSEFCGDETVIVLYNGKDIKIHTLGELLPYTFNKASIK